MFYFTCNHGLKNWNHSVKVKHSDFALSVVDVSVKECFPFDDDVMRGGLTSCL